MLKIAALRKKSVMNFAIPSVEIDAVSPYKSHQITATKRNIPEHTF